jgi:hypothetical protein
MPQTLISLIYRLKMSLFCRKGENRGKVEQRQPTAERKSPHSSASYSCGSIHSPLSAPSANAAVDFVLYSAAVKSDVSLKGTWQRDRFPECFFLLALIEHSLRIGRLFKVSFDSRRQLTSKTKKIDSPFHKNSKSVPLYGESSNSDSPSKTIQFRRQYSTLRINIKNRILQ